MGILWLIFFAIATVSVMDMHNHCDKVCRKAKMERFIEEKRLEREFNEMFEEDEEL